jgi:hypothetical protein
MREKLAEYAAEGAAWPLCANILDPVRASVVCGGPGQMVEVAEWFLGVGSSLPICKARGAIRPRSPSSRNLHLSTIPILPQSRSFRNLHPSAISFSIASRTPVGVKIIWLAWRARGTVCGTSLHIPPQNPSREFEGVALTLESAVPPTSVGR